MSKTVRQVPTATFICDWCAAKVVMELDSIKYERSQYVSGEDEAPPGWVMASSPGKYKSDSIPNLYFDSLDHFNEWKADAVQQYSDRIVRILK